MATLFLFSTADHVLKDLARARAEGISGSSVEGLDNLDDFIRVLHTYAQGRDPIRELTLFAHGAPGEVTIGRTTVVVTRLDRLRNKGLDRAFSANARIVFESCEIAGSADGELFLAEFGSILLRRGGGEVVGSTGSGATPWGWFGGAVWYFGAREVKARVNVGGGVRLINNVYLRADRLRNTIDYFRERIQEARSWRRTAIRRKCATWERLLNTAHRLIASPGAPYRDIYRAWVKVDAVRRSMQQLGVIPADGTLIPEWLGPYMPLGLHVSAEVPPHHLPDARAQATSVNNVSRGLEAAKSAYPLDALDDATATTTKDRSV
jgi:hypothetical protein